MKNLILLLSLTLVFGWKSSNAQSRELDWTYHIGGSFIDEVSHIVTDKSGNVYLSGEFWGKIDFDKGIDTLYLDYTKGNKFLVKLDTGGSPIWAKQMEYDFLDLEIDADGNIYGVGVFNGLVDFDPGIDSLKISSLGQNDGFILRLSPQGDLIWVKPFASVGWDHVNDIEIDRDKNLYVTGAFQDTVHMGDPAQSLPLITQGDRDVFVAKYDTSGSLTWVKTFGGTGGETGLSLALVDTNTVYISGQFSQTVDFDPGPNTNSLSTGMNSGFVCKFNHLGDFDWVYNLQDVSGTHTSLCSELTIDSLKNIYVTGVFNGTADFDAGMSSYTLTSGLSSVFLVKLSPQRDFKWATQYKSADYVARSADIETDKSGNIYVTGRISGDVYFDSTSSAPSTGFGSNDIFITQHDSTGSLKWVKHVGAQSNDEGVGLDIDKNGNLYCTGNFQNNPTFHSDSNGTTNLFSRGRSDIYVLKLACALDSAVVLNGITLTSNVSNGYYKLLDCNNGYSVVKEGHSNSLYPDVDGDYALEITKDGCTVVSSCYSIRNISLAEKVSPLSMHLYPNPGKGHFEVELNKWHQELRFSISNIHGQSVAKYYLQEGVGFSFEFDGSPGLYFLSVQDGSGNKTTTKFILQ